MPKPQEDNSEPKQTEEPMKDVQQVAARNEQRDASKRATFDLLKMKPRAEREVLLKIPGEDGEIQELSMLFRAIGSQEYDKLLSKNPPTLEQKADGSAYNVNTFGPSLLSKVCIEPDMDTAQWTVIWNSPDWGRGEVMQLFLVAVELCNKGLDIPFIGND